MSDAQGERDLFFTDGAGSGHPSSAEIGAEAGLLEGLVSQFGDLETALSDAQDAYDDASDAHISAEEDATFLTFAEGTSEVSVSFDAGENTYGGVLDISNPISLSGFQAFAETLLTGDLDHAVSPEDLAGVVETITSVTFTTHVQNEEVPVTEGDELPPVTEGDGERANSDDDNSASSVAPSLVGSDEFVSLVVDASDEALVAANAALVDRDTELTSAQGERDGFFVDGAGDEFDDLGDLQSVASDLRAAETEAQRT